MAGMTVKIPELDHGAFMEALHRMDTDTMDRMTEQIDRCKELVFDLMQKPEFCTAYYDMEPAKNGNFMRYILHRSTRHSDFQLSCAEIRGEQFIPTSHADIHTFEDLRTRMPNGISVFFR